MVSKQNPISLSFQFNISRFEEVHFDRLGFRFPSERATARILVVPSKRSQYSVNMNEGCDEDRDMKYLVGGTPNVEVNGLP